MRTGLKYLLRILPVSNFMLLAMLLFGCVEERVLSRPAPDLNDNYDLPGYMAIGLSNSSLLQTKDDEKIDLPDYDDGLKNEYALAMTGSHHFCVVYGKTSRYPSAILSLSPFAISPGNPSDKATLSVSSIFSSNDISEDILTRENLKEFLSDKEYFLIVNTDLKKEQLEALTKNELLTTVADNFSIRVDGTEYFTMTNSVYLASDNKTVVYDGEIHPDYIFSSKEEAMANPAVKIHVERLAAKYSVDVSRLCPEQSLIESDNTGQNLIFYPSSKISVYEGLEITPEGYTIKSLEKGWQFEISGYMINGLERGGYLFKNIRPITYYDSYSWNEPSAFRCSWTEDPNYEINSGSVSGYPHQFRKALETDTVRSYHDSRYSEGSSGAIKINPDNQEFALIYKSFNSLIGNFKETYTHENTFDDSDETNSGSLERLWEKGKFSAATHLVLGGRLIIEDSEATRDIYRDRNNIFYPDKELLMKAKTDILNGWLFPAGNTGINIPDIDWLNHISRPSEHKKIEWAKNSVLWICSDGNEHEARPDDFTLMSAEISGGDSQVILIPKDSGKSYFISPKDSDTGRRSPDNSIEISFNDLTTLLFTVFGGLDHYFNGYMYYCAPVTHRVNDLDKALWNRRGDMAAVRNHWYKLHINDIKGTGHPVDDPAQPIIPAMQQQPHDINLSIEVLGWHVITQENVSQSEAYGR